MSIKSNQKLSWNRKCPRCGGIEKASRIDSQCFQVWCMKCGHIEVMKFKDKEQFNESNL